MAFNPILGSAETEETMNTGLGRKFKLILFGLEGKYYHRYIASGLFSRLGLGYTQLNNDGSLGNLTGYNVYLGTGWEYDFRGVGIAFEMAYRYSRFSSDVILNSFTPSIGVHFYR